VKNSGGIFEEKQQKEKNWRHY